MAARQWCGLSAAAALAMLPAAAFGQYGTKVPTTTTQPVQQKQELHGKGEFDAVGSGGFKAQLDGATWLCKFEPKAKVVVSGTATAEALAPGLFVRFKGEFDKKGKASEEVKELEVFTPSEKDPIGATPAGGGGNFSDPTPAKKGPSTTPTAYDIAGRITSIKKGTIMVACGNMTVHADVASDATITVNIADLSVASPGDKIEVRGWYVKGKEGYGYATDVKVDLANPLTGPKKKGAHAAKTADKGTETADATDTKKADKTKKTDPKAADKKPADDPKATDDKKPADAKAVADKDKADAAK